MATDPYLLASALEPIAIAYPCWALERKPTAKEKLFAASARVPKALEK